MTQFGQRESVTRGQPSVGFVFCQDFKSGLSDHFGVNEGFGLYLLKTWIELKMAPAAVARPCSAYLIALIINAPGANSTQYRSSLGQPPCPAPKLRNTDVLWEYHRAPTVT